MSLSHESLVECVFSYVCFFSAHNLLGSLPLSYTIFFFSTVAPWTSVFDCTFNHVPLGPEIFHEANKIIRLEQTDLRLINVVKRSMWNFKVRLKYLSNLHSTSTYKQIWQVQQQQQQHLMCICVCKSQEHLPGEVHSRTCVVNVWSRNKIGQCYTQTLSRFKKLLCAQMVVL